MSHTDVSLDFPSICFYVQIYFHSSTCGLWLTKLVDLVGLGSDATLEECLMTFFSSERLQGQNKYFCAQCGSLQNAMYAMHCVGGRMPLGLYSMSLPAML